jgi:hypothetical protein
LVGLSGAFRIAGPQIARAGDHNPKNAQSGSWRWTQAFRIAAKYRNRMLTKGVKRMEQKK